MFPPAPLPIHRVNSYQLQAIQEPEKTDLWITSHIHIQGGGKTFKSDRTPVPEGMVVVTQSSLRAAREPVQPPTKSLGRRWRSVLGIGGGTRQGKGDKTRLLSQKHVTTTPSCREGQVGDGVAASPWPWHVPLPYLVHCLPGAKARDTGPGSHYSPLPVQGQLCKSKGRVAASFQHVKGFHKGLFS